MRPGEPNRAITKGALVTIDEGVPPRQPHRAPDGISLIDVAGERGIVTYVGRSRLSAIVRLDDDPAVSVWIPTRCLAIREAVR